MKTKPVEIKTFDDVVLTNPTVSMAMRAGLSPKEIIVALHNEMQKMHQRLVELKSIAPKRMRTADGRVFVWHCPDQLIPEQQIDSSTLEPE